MYLLDKRVMFLLSFASQNGSSMLLTLNLNYMYMHDLRGRVCPLRGSGGACCPLSSISPLLGRGGGGVSSIGSPGRGGRSTAMGGPLGGSTEVG